MEQQETCPAYTGVLVSLVFQGEGSRLCRKGEHGVPSSLPLNMLSNGAWSRMEISGVGESVNCKLLFPFFDTIFPEPYLDICIETKIS
jgi:hypothetical protein